MASLVEFQDFKLNQHQMTMFQDTSDLQAFEDLLGRMELPTPPLSPDHEENAAAPATNSSQLLSQSNLDIGETILQQMMASEDLIFDSQSTYGSDSSDIFETDPSILSSGQALLQDCMWNGEAYEPRHSISTNGIYTPAPSPPPAESKDSIEEEEDEEERVSTCSKSKENDQAECISPTEVFTFVTASDLTAKEHQVTNTNGRMERETHKSSCLGHRRNVSSTYMNSRVHPQATTSESEEEIDVVTISDRPEKPINNRMVTRKRNTSMSAPCSRHVSPTRLPPTKKRRCHSKRTHRLSSVGSNFGDGTESDEELRRASHNVLERKRRNDLKYSFQILRGQIPELEENQRAPKVTILRKAAEYIKQIKEKEEELQSRMARERRRESKLLQRLAYLKSI